MTTRIIQDEISKMLVDLAQIEEQLCAMAYQLTVPAYRDRLVLVDDRAGFRHAFPRSIEVAYPRSVACQLW